jgi:subtilisin family serine protease
MKNIFLILSSLLFAPFLFAQSTATEGVHRIIIKFKADSAPIYDLVMSDQHFHHDALDAFHAENHLTLIKLTGNRKNKDTYALEFETTTTVANLIDFHQKTGLFIYVEPNHTGTGHGVQTIPNDTNFNRQWSHVNDGSFTLSSATVDADMDTDLAWDITQGDPNLIVAILDSGAKLNHPEFAGRIWSNSNESQNNFDSDLNGFTDDLNGGWDFANNDNDPTDDHGHGTNVAGIAVGSGNNNTGYAGMNWNSQIMICKVLDGNNNGFYSWWADGIYYAVDNGAAVINLSAGGFSPSLLLRNAVDYAYANNVAVVVSTGNQNSLVQYPAVYDNAIAVGSTNADDTRSVPFFWSTSSGSNFGQELDFVAPGNFIYGLSHLSNFNYNSYWGGTSQAAPQVAGLISLLISVKPNLTVDEIRTILEDTAEDQVGNMDDTPGWDAFYGHGRINAFEALVNATLSIDTVGSTNENLLIHPNPIDTNQTLEVTNLLDGTYTVVIYNTLGQRLHAEKVIALNSKTALSLIELNPGTYLINIKNDIKNTSITKKFIVK